MLCSVTLKKLDRNILKNGILKNINVLSTVRVFKITQGGCPGHITIKQILKRHIMQLKILYKCLSVMDSRHRGALLHPVHRACYYTTCYLQKVYCPVDSVVVV